ncbi:hypothetical protein AX14_009783 [Amanita brunnescens Koide BX004]|nr:hypothetical protein AX14_009783 [Amanita brunnescens Koide BX004]
MSSSPTIYRRDIARRPKIFEVWEQYRNQPGVHYVMELFGEAMGVFFYTYAGIGATAPFIIGSILKQDGLGSIFQIGWGYAIGIILALCVSGATSGGHISPSITIAFTIFRGFPVKKAPGYIIAQIFGAYVASILIYHQWEVFIHEAEAALKQAGVYDQLQFTPSGTAGIFALYLPSGQTYGRVFLNEFVNSALVGLVVWACIDPTNVAIPPAFAPFVIAIAYAVVIWGFAVPAIALNTARDLGARLMAMTYWGTAAAGGRYAAIAALTNIPATLFSVCLYEFFFADSDRVVPKAHLEYVRVAKNHKRLGGSHGSDQMNTPLESRKESISEEYEHTRV